MSCPTTTLPLNSGNDYLLTFTTTNGATPPVVKNLTGATEIIFAIAKKQGAVPFLELKLTDASPQIVITDAVNGVFTVELKKADTEPLTAKHEWFEVRATDAAGKTATVAKGKCVVSINSITA